MREVLLSFRVYFLKTASLSLWVLLLPYITHVVLMGDGKEHLIVLAVVIDSGGEQVTQGRSIRSSIFYFFLSRVTTLRLQSRGCWKSPQQCSCHLGGSSKRKAGAHSGADRDAVEGLGMASPWVSLCMKLPVYLCPFCCLLSLENVIWIIVTLNQGGLIKTSRRERILAEPRESSRWSGAVQ